MLKPLIQNAFGPWSQVEHLALWSESELRILQLRFGTRIGLRQRQGDDQLSAEHQYCLAQGSTFIRVTMCEHPHLPSSSQHGLRDAWHCL